MCKGGGGIAPQVVWRKNFIVRILDSYWAPAVYIRTVPLAVGRNGTGIYMLAGPYRLLALYVGLGLHGT